ncbi:hypothetical protein [Pseudodesulfovibrio sp.]|uniref:hypothetical protein n=1 Tax=Pseudodesulfovibrio sp. TaxID=2035812 RepID=UPI00260524D4|nr:hypothetical protein [Pseudodesulfovibrio sp.]MDD3310558.1 hypothetical protein [Pseudodesulfovibrio sp.]
MRSVVVISPIALEWIYIGYTLCFGPDMAIGPVRGLARRLAGREPPGPGRPLDMVGIHGRKPRLFPTRLTGIAVAGGYTLVPSWIILKTVNAISPLRMADRDEERGVDTSEHGKTAYQA